MKSNKPLYFLSIIAITFTLFNLISCEFDLYEDGEKCAPCSSDFQCNDGLSCNEFVAIDNSNRTWKACGAEFGFTSCQEY